LEICPSAEILPAVLNLQVWLIITPRNALPSFKAGTPPQGVQCEEQQPGSSVAVDVAGSPFATSL
jgi:hypothetical protein